MGTCLVTCLELSYASTVQWPGICLAWVMRWTFTLPFSMGIHCWTVAIAQTSSACSQPRLLQLRWSQRQEESGCWPAKLMTTCRVRHLTFNLSVTFDLFALKALLQSCWQRRMHFCEILLFCQSVMQRAFSQMHFTYSTHAKTCYAVFCGLFKVYWTKNWISHTCSTYYEKNWHLWNTIVLYHIGVSIMACSLKKNAIHLLQIYLQYKSHLW